MSTEKQLIIATDNQYEKKMLFHSRIRTACCLIVALAASLIFYYAASLTGQIQSILGAVDSVSAELAQADISSMLGDVQSLVLDAQGMTADAQNMIADAHGTLTNSAEGLDGALNHISAIDIDTLNTAIEDLAAVVEPLARFFGR